MKEHGKPGYKMTPFGWIPEDWEIDTFQKRTEILVAKDLQENKYSKFRDTNYRFPVYSNSVEDQGLYGYYNSPEYREESCTIVGRGVGLGTAFYRDHSFGAIGRLLILYPKYNLTALYLANFVNGLLNLFQESGGIPQLTGESLSKYKIIVPPLPEQKAIAKVLSTWDKAIEKTQELIKQKELRKKYLMQRLLTGEKRLKGFSGEWKRASAGEVFISVSKKANHGEELLSATQDKGIIPRNMLPARVTMPTGDTEAFKLVEEGDFVISLRSFQGGLEYSYYRGIVSPSYTVLKPKLEINAEFYKYYFKSYDFIGHLAAAVIGIRDGKQISYDDFCLVKVPNPKIREQETIAKVLMQSDSELALLKKHLETLELQKKGLMQVLLTGRKRLNHECD